MNRKPYLYQHYTWPEMAEVEAFLRLVREFKNRARGERTDWHKTPWQS